MSHHSQKKAPTPAPRNGRATTVLRVVLIAFVMTAVTVLIVREVRSRTTQTPGTQTTVSTPSALSPSDSGVIPTTGETSIPVTGVVAYYFHTTARCTSCLTIERWTAEAIQTAFATQLADGTLTWRVVDVEDTANAHFIEDYQLVSKSVVLVRYTNGKPGKWENLQKVWQLLSDRTTFQDYVTSSTRSFLETQE